MVFAVNRPGFYVSMGPTVGAMHHHPARRIFLLRMSASALALVAVRLWDNLDSPPLIIGRAAVFSSIFLPKGILGSLIEPIESATHAKPWLTLSITLSIPSRTKRNKAV